MSPKPLLSGSATIGVMRPLGVATATDIATYVYIV